MKSPRQAVRNDPKRARVGATRTSSNSNYREVKKIGQKPKRSSTELAGGLDARFREVMDAAPVMIWVSDEDKGCVWFNKPWLKFTGRRLTQEVGNGWSEGVHRDDFDAA
jgi:PAS domain-containing protein